jgi:hypothetical protein
MESVEEIGHIDTLSEDEISHWEPGRAAQTSALQKEWDPTSNTPVVEEEPKEDKAKPAKKAQEEKTEEPKMLTEKQKEKLRKKAKYKNMPKSKSHGQVSFKSC